MKKIILIAMFAMIRLFAVEAVAQNLALTPVLDVQSASLVVNYNLNATGHNAPWSFALKYKVGSDTTTYSTYAQTIGNNIDAFSSGFCTDSLSVSMYYEITHIQTGSKYYTDTLNLLMPQTAVESSNGAVLPFLTIERNVVCNSGISSRCVNVGDSAKISFLSFRGYAPQGIDSIKLYRNSQLFGHLNYVGPGSQPGLLIYVMTINNASQIIAPGDTITTWVKKSATSTSNWVNLDVDVISGIPVEANDHWVQFSYCAPLARIEAQNCTVNTTNYITFSAPDTVSIGQNLCIHVDMQTNAPAKLNLSGLAPFQIVNIVGDTTICFPITTNCGTSSVWTHWSIVDQANGNLIAQGDTSLRPVIREPYTVSISQVGATNALVGITTDTAGYFVLSDNNGGIIDSIYVTHDTVWYVSNLSPNTGYYIYLHIDNICGGDGFTTDNCSGVSAIGISSTDSVRFLIRYSKFAEHSLAWVNGVEITLIRDSVAGNFAYMHFSMPISSSLELIGPCGDQHIYNVITGTETLSLTTSLTAYPNPTIGLVRIEGLPQNGTWTVMNALGQIVAVGKNEQVDLTSQPSGFYFLTAFSPDGSKTTKVVKE